MNKIKLIYDVVVKLKQKEKVAGKLTAQGVKEGKEILDANISFEKDCIEGLFKTDISINVDCDKKKFKHQSKTEVECNKKCCGKSHEKLFKHIHKAHDMDKKCCHGKGKLSKLAFGLQLLYNIKLEELADDKVQLTLNLSDMPEELCKNVHEKIVTHCEQKHKDMFKNCCNIDKHDGEIEVIVNDKKEIEKIIVKVSGLKNNGKDDTTVVEFKGQVDLY